MIGILQFLLLLAVAGACGAAGQALAGFTRSGCLISVALGFVGAVVGTWLATLLGLPALFAIRIGGSPFPIAWSIIGSALFVAVLGLMTGRRRPPAR